MKHVPATTEKTAFNCPHCGALSHQTWFNCFAVERARGSVPDVINEDRFKEIDFDQIKGKEEQEKVRYWAHRMSVGKPFLERGAYGHTMPVNNIWFSSCFNCSDIAIWLTNQMLYPQTGRAPVANPDMPTDIRCDYEEASKIMNASPRGAAALIRLAIQKLCKELGQPGKNINKDIAALVKNGLHPQIQQALDSVRVIGNNAVHPGQIDLQDDSATVETLFHLLNIIVEKTISEPRKIQEIYDGLPLGARKAIEKRDGGAVS